MFRKNVAGQFIHFQGVDASTGGIKSGVTWTVRRCIDGTFAAGDGTVTEDGTTGWYKYAMSQADTNGNDIAFNFTGTGAVPQTVNIVTTAADPTDGVRFGLTALPNANAEAAGGLYTRGAGAGQINQPANGQIDANAVKLGGTTQTGRDIGVSVLVSPGTGTGQVDLSSGKVLLQPTQTGVTIPTVTTLTDAPSDSSGVTTLLSRLSALRAGYLDNLSAGAAALESSLQALITTVGAAGAGLTATASAVWSVATRLLTAGTNIVLAKGTGITGFNDLSAADVNAEVDAALTDYDAPTHAELTAELATADDATLAAIGALNNLSQADVRSAVGLASANLDTQLAGIPTSDLVATAVRNNFTGLISSNIKFIEAGGASTGDLSLWDGSITGSPTVDTAVKPEGAYSSLKFASGEELEALVLGPTRRISFVFRLDALPTSGNDPFFELRDFNDVTIAFVTITDAGKLAWTDPTLSSTVEGSRVLSINHWYQIAVCYDSHNTSDDLDLKIYLDGVEEVSVVGASTNANPFISETDSLHFFAGTSGRNIWIAHVYVDDGSDLGYPGNIGCTAKFSAAVNVDDFDTTGGTGAVNERPLSETNYRQQAATTQVRQNYNLQSASDGDLDISQKTILGYMGWVRGKRGAGLGGQSTKLTVNGIDYTVSLGGTPASHRQPVTDNNYPTDNAGIGLLSTGSSLDTYLYECGAVIAYIEPVFPPAGTIADAVWDEDIATEHQTAGTAGKKLNQALILYEGS